MEPVAFLKLAKSLCKQSNNEAALRTAVSRGYYGLFNLAKQFIEQYVHKLPKGAESHVKVYHYLNNCGLEEIVEVAGDLNELRDDRNNADYQLDINVFQDVNFVTLACSKAQLAYNNFEAVSKNSKNRHKLIRGIREYMNKTNN